MIDVGCFEEMHIFSNNGSIYNFIVDTVNYDIDSMVKYLSSFRRQAICPRAAIDCVTGKEISTSFKVFSDGEYPWCDFLIYHIQKYKIRLPQGLIDKANAAKTFDRAKEAGVSIRYNDFYKDGSVWLMVLLRNEKWLQSMNFTRFYVKDRHLM